MRRKEHADPRSDGHKRLMRAIRDDVKAVSPREIRVVVRVARARVRIMKDAHFAGIVALAFAIIAT